jgi:hypothetical protein
LLKTHEMAMALTFLTALTVSMPMAFQVWLREPSHGNRTESTSAGDWFVLAHLGFFFMLLSCFGWAAWSIWKRTNRPEPHIQWLMEMDQADAATWAVKGEGERPKRQPEEPWERPADWWK